jgi:antitoxin (DNA-binding transcriptional repressor) of toxin-antitoxin stability system
MVIISASEARQTLPAQLDKVAAGETIQITRHGRIVAFLVSPRTMAANRAREAWAFADWIGEELEAAKHRPIGPGSMSHERAEEIIAWMDGDAEDDE